MYTDHGRVYTDQAIALFIVFAMIIDQLSIAMVTRLLHIGKSVRTALYSASSHTHRRERRQEKEMSMDTGQA